MDRENSPINCLLEQAASIARRSKITTGTLEPTESYKRRQIEELISFADSCNLWIDFSSLNITYMDKGGENEVFHDGNLSVLKLNNFEYAGDDLENFLSESPHTTDSSTTFPTHSLDFHTIVKMSFVRY